MKYSMNKHDGQVIHARLLDGTTLPVVDVTNRAFQVSESPDRLSELRAAIAAPASRPASADTPALGKPSDLVQRMFAPSAQYLDGLATYLLKVGPDNLPPHLDTGIERRLVSSPNAMALRIRLQQISRLMAQALKNTPSSAPLRFLTIGGGTAIEVLNALIVLKSARSKLPKVEITVLDVSGEGVALGKAALAALRGPQGPLAGVIAEIEFVPYSWDQPLSLVPALQNRETEREFVLVSSEGALFEYGSFKTIITNLKLLHRAGPFPIAGSILRDDAAGKAMAARSPFPLTAYGPGGLERMASAAGYRIASVIEGVASDQFLLEAH